MSKSRQDVEVGILTNQLKNLESIYQHATSEIGVDISEAEDTQLRVGRTKYSRRHSFQIEESRRKNSYKNPLTGQQIEWVERPMDEKPLSDKIRNRTDFFMNTEQVDWMLIAVPGNNQVYYGVLDGAVPMGIVKMKPGGYFKLHWHNETEHYLITSGRGKFTIGAHEQEVNIDTFPVLVTIPGNVPHQVYNPYDKDLIWYYFFPEVTCTNTMRYFYPCGTHTDVYRRFPSTERSEKTLKEQT